MASQSAITLPRDHYAHPDAPTEWWWHIGTLKSGDRVFGFEIALNGSSQQGAVFTQLMLTDVQNQKHYQSTSGALYAADWAESDPTKPWYAVVDAPGVSASQNAPAENPLNMSVQASFADIDTGTQIAFELQLDQQGPPLLVWGNGFQDGNYYYSLTNLQASGSISIDGESHAVEGVTWMDHEWGVFPKGTNWILQNMQFDNGVSIMNYSNAVPALGVAMPGHATVLTPDGTSTEYDSAATPLGPTWTDRNGITYFTKWQVEIPALEAAFEVASLMPGQAFEQVVKIYEGVAVYLGTVGNLSAGGEIVTGTAWNEQRMKD